MTLATLSMATATSTKDANALGYHGISLFFITDIPKHPYMRSPAPVEINKLTNVSGASASVVAFDQGVSPNVDNHKVECRVFKDAQGVVPAGKPINYKTPLFLSGSETVPISSILCYVVTDEEAAAF